MCCSIELFILLQLFRDRIAASLLASGVLWIDIGLLWTRWAKATHCRPRYPPTSLTAPTAFLCAVGRFGAPVFFVLSQSKQDSTFEVSSNLERWQFLFRISSEFSFIPFSNTESRYLYNCNKNDFSFLKMIGLYFVSQSWGRAGSAR